jgi:hypothetical protein
VYVNLINYRKQLGYKVVKDMNCGIELVLMTKLTVRLIRNFPLNSKVKRKKIIVVSTLVSTLWFGNVQPSPAMGLSIPAAPVVRIQPSYRHLSEVKTAPTVSPRLDKIVMIANNKMIPFIYLNAQQVHVNQKILKRLQRGSLASGLVIIAIVGVVYLILLSAGVDGFAILQQIGSVNAPTTSTSSGFTPTGSSLTEIALVPTQAQQFNDMSSKFNEPKPNFIMTKDEALKIISKTYPG